VWLYIAVPILVVFLFVVAWLFFRKAFRRPKARDLTDEEVFLTSDYFGYAAVMLPALEWFQKQPFEELSLEAADGTALRGLWLPKRGGKACLLLMHDYASLPQDLCLIARWAARKGWSVLLPYQRAHGPSGGYYCSLGLLEAEDCVLWAKKAEELAPGNRLVLYGSGMGGFTVLYALSREGMPAAAAAVSEGTYDSPRGILKTVMREQMRMRTFPLLQILLLYGAVVWRRSAGGADLRLSLKEDRGVPLLLIHGKKDLRVPVKMTEEIAKDCAGRKETYFCEEAGHGACAMAEGEAFFKKLEAFLQGCL
jgi:alpha-beta hydrolase superfamily lysophospholipase